MHVYSTEGAFGFGKVRPRHIYCLLEIIYDSRLRERAFIASRFADVATHFEETLRFLEEISWLTSSNGRLVPHDEITAALVRAVGAERDALLLEALIDAPGPYQQLFARYLSCFERRDAIFVYNPTTEARLSDATVRDFLMDVGAVTHRVDANFYVLEEPFADWALWARNVMGPSAKQMQSQIARRIQIGRAAELAALDWEKQRVGQTWQHRVRHVADENPTACFDIRSVSIDGTRIEPRFIEVKAVALESSEFHWSRAEIEAAEILGSQYFLYLVPVTSNGTFNVSCMEIVRNPFHEVYRNASTWSTIVADTICRKRTHLVS